MHHRGCGLSNLNGARSRKECENRAKYKGVVREIYEYEIEIEAEDGGEVKYVEAKSYTDD